MAAGDNTAGSIIWVPGEPTGKNIYGAVHAVPTNEIANSITVSGGAPVAAPGALPFQFNTATRKLSAWTGSAWVTVSGA